MLKLHAQFLFAPLLILPFIGTTSAFADGASAAAFVQATCVAYVDDLSKLDSLAKEKGWQQVANLGGNLGLNSTRYQATQGNETFWVTGLALAASGNWCSVDFRDAMVKQEEFFNAISAGLKLKISSLTVRQDGSHTDTYEIQSDQPKKKLLLMMWNDGRLFSVSINAPPVLPFGDAASAATFVQATCFAYVDDLSKLDSLAKETGWQTSGTLRGKIPLPGYGDEQLKSTYVATQGNEKFTVRTGVGMSPIFDKANVCGVTFGGKLVKREEFFNAISAGLELKTVPSMTVTQNGFHTDTYEIRSEQPKKKFLQMAWSDNSSTTLLGVDVIAPQ